MEYYNYHDVNFRGSIDRVYYKTTNKDGEEREKYVNVYLPKNYDQNDTNKKYDILYLMHGGGGNPDAWLDCSKIKNMLDYMIDQEIINPLIVAFPSYYKEKISRIGEVNPNEERFNVLFFQKELGEEMIPAVETKYHTYAKDCSKTDLKESRWHRAFGGFSMGSCTTWFALLNHLDEIATFLPLSGDCWEIEPLGGKKDPKETAKRMYQIISENGWKASDFKIFAATGTEDPAFLAMAPMIDVLKEYIDLFNYSDDFATGNLHYFVADKEIHAYETVYHYVYNYLPYLFGPAVNGEK